MPAPNLQQEIRMKLQELLRQTNRVLLVKVEKAGIYEIMVSWKGAGLHTTILQRFEDVELRYIEPQVDNSKGSAQEGRTFNWLCNHLTVKPYVYRGYLDDGVMRIDNKIFDKTFYESFDIQ